MMRIPFLLAAVLLLVLASPLKPAHAEDLASGGFDPAMLDKLAEQVRQTLLTEDMVNRFLASYPEMKAVGVKFPGTETPDDTSEQSEVDALPPEKRKAMEEVATKYGFKTLEEWITVTSSVVMSYAYVREGKSPTQLNEMVDRAVAAAEADDKLTQEQRQKAIEQYRMIGTKLAKLQPLPENSELVEKMIGKIAPVMKIQ